MFGFIPRSLAVVGIVGGLAFAMPVAASADAWDYALFELIASGGGALAGEGIVAASPEVVAGSGMACAAALPVCAAVAAATVGAALYLTHDTWLPWVNGLHLGASQVPQGSYVMQAGWARQTLAWVAQPSGSENLQYRVASILGTDAAGYIESEATCMRSDGTVYARGPVWTDGPSYQQHVVVNNYAGVNFSDGGCPAGEVIQSAHITSHWSDDWSKLIAESLVWGGGGVSAPSMEVQCVNPDGSQYAVTAAVPAVGDLIKMPTCTGAAGDLGGAHGKCVTLSATAPGASTPVVQSSDCVAAGTAGLLYPECMAAGCIYRVIVDGVPCTVGRPGCTDWARTYATTPGRVGCRYGEHAVSVDHCFFMERVYEASGAPVPATLGNTDGNPATFTGTPPASSEQPQPTPAPIPNGAPGGAPGTLPGAGTGALPSPGSDPQTNNDCWSGGSFSWNPIDWVMVPTKCALSWAFVPKTATLTNLAASAKTDLTTQGIGPIVNAVNVNVQKVGGGGGCDGPAVTFSAVGIVKPMHPFSACTAPMSTLASISYAMTTVIVVLGGGFAAVNAIGQGFGFHFRMRGNGGDSA